ncbi:hypothetical protein XENTR_v10011023 [Xenopus tropicalis]|nr:hypothetical protein XENTR_v10011023 [Xenopus tropicalis]
MNFFYTTSSPVFKSLNPSHNLQICSTFGNYHFKTFDGDIFHYPGGCNYVFASHCKSSFEEFNIQIRRSLRETIPVISSINIKIEEKMFVLLNNSRILFAFRVNLPYRFGGIQISKSDAYIRVFSIIGVEMLWNEEDSLLLELSPKFANQTCGLCGDFNGIPIHNEFIVNDVQLTETQYGNLQKYNGPTERCDDVAEQQEETCISQNGDLCSLVLNGPAFQECNQLVDASKYIELCEQDFCGCSENSTAFCICNIFTEYSRQCAHAGGKPQNWRTSELCPLRCDYNLEYNECGTACPDTCSNFERSLVCDEHCKDGCFCPMGMVYDDVNFSGCIPKEQCSCTYNGKVYATGTGYTEKCQTCTCHGGKWNCEKSPCYGTCALEGGSHITTFDRNRYNFHGDCFYTLSRTCENDLFRIVAELRPCGQTDTETCLRSVTISLNEGKDLIVVGSEGIVHVNSLDSQLPVSTANAVIFKPSSFFIIVQTKVGIQVTIQHKPSDMQVYIRADPALMNTTCGLCGNFNNKTDDFNSPNGVHQGTGAPFGNTWKAQADCPKVKNSFEDPCALSSESERYASHWCSMLKDTEGPFSACHKSVDPTYYYKTCLFDTCNRENTENCMCTALSSYVYACSREGIYLKDWRTSVCSNFTNCPTSFTYNYTISTFQPTCRSISEPDYTYDVSFVPVDGCICKDGTYLDDTGNCVPPSLCPCFNNGATVPPGQVIHEKGAVCTCTNGKLDCIGKKPIQKECEYPLVYFNCSNTSAETKGSECQKSCSTFDKECYSTKCISGCMCPSGLMLDDKGNCIQESDCPCVYNDEFYSPGEKIKVQCNTCICRNRMWDCTDNTCLGTCTAYGDGHYVTFDNKRYQFSGNCQYTLAQDFCSNDTTAGTFRVITENIPCGTTGTTCSKSIKVFLGNYELILGDENVEVINREVGEYVPFNVLQMGIYLVIEAANGLVLVWDKKTTIYIKLAPDFQGTTCGLCGNYDVNAENDFLTRSMSEVGDVNEFGNSWKLSPSCQDAMAVKEPCSTNPYRKAWSQKQCSIITGPTFSSCHALVNPVNYYEACVNDACACDTGGDCECTCTAVAAYAQACSEAGECVQWRTPKMCPIFCDFYNHDEECEWHYKPCGAPCMKTCRNPTGVCYNNLSGLEGCYPDCPAERPYFDETSMTCVSSCNCYDDYRKEYEPGEEMPGESIFCCYYEGKNFLPGEVIYSTMDGIGGCIEAICSDNSTIKRNIGPCTSTLGPSTIFNFSTSSSIPTSRSTQPSVSVSPGSVTSHTGLITTATSPGTVSSTVGIDISNTSQPTIPSKSQDHTTTISNVSPTICFEAYNCTWSDWYDVSRPGLGPNDGDFETFDNIKAKGFDVCKNPTKVECRAKEYPYQAIKELNQNVSCSKKDGLICVNTKNAICHNFEIRVECCEYRKCHEYSRTTASQYSTSGQMSMSTVTDTLSTEFPITRSTGIKTTTSSKNSSISSVTSTLMPVTQFHSSSGTSTTEKISVTQTKTMPPPPSILISTLESSAISSATASSPRSPTTSIVKPTLHIPQTTTLSSIVTEGPSPSSVTEPVTVKSTLSTEVPITRPLETTPSKHSSTASLTTTPLPMTQSHSSSLISTTEKISVPGTKVTPSPPPSILTSTLKSPVITSASGTSPRSQTTSIVKPTSHISQPTTLSSIVSEGPSTSSVTEPVNVKSTLSTEVPITRPLETSPLPGIVITTPSKHSSTGSLTTTPLPVTQSHSSSVTSTTEKISVPETKATPSPPPSILTSTLESPAITSATASSPRSPTTSIVKPTSHIPQTTTLSSIVTEGQSTSSVTEPVTMKSTLSTEVPITRPLETTPLPGIVTTSPSKHSSAASLTTTPLPITQSHSSSVTTTTEKISVPETKATPFPPPSTLTSTSEGSAISSASASSPRSPTTGIVKPTSHIPQTTTLSSIVTEGPSTSSVTELVTVKSTLSTEVPITRPLETTPLPGVVTSTPSKHSSAASLTTTPFPMTQSHSSSVTSTTEKISVPETKATPSPPPSMLTSTLESPAITSATASSPRSQMTSIVKPTSHIPQTTTLSSILTEGPSTSSVTEPVNVKSTLSTEVPITRPLETTPLPGIVTSTPSKHSSAASLTTTPLPMTQTHSSSVTSTTEEISVPETKATPSPPPSILTSTLKSPAITSASGTSPRSQTTSPSTSSVTEPVNTTPLPGIVTTTPSKHSSAASLTTTPLPMTQSHSSSVTSTTEKISVPETKATPSPPPSILTSTSESSAISSASASSPSVTEPVTVKSTLSTEVPITRPLETTPLPGIVTSTPKISVPETKATPSPPPSILTSTLESPAITSASGTSPRSQTTSIVKPTSHISQPTTLSSIVSEGPSTSIPITRPLETTPLPGIVTTTPIPETKATPSPPPSILTSTSESSAISSASASSPRSPTTGIVKPTSHIPQTTTLSSIVSEGPSTSIPITRPLETTPLPGIVTSTPKISVPETKATPSPPPSILTSTLKSPAITSASGTSPSVTKPVNVKSTLSTEVPITRPLETTPLPGIVTTTPSKHSSTVPETKATPSPPPSILTSTLESPAITSASGSSSRSQTTSIVKPTSHIPQTTTLSSIVTEVPLTRPLETTPLPGIVTSTPIPGTKVTPSPPPSILTSTLESPAITSASASSPSVTEPVNVKSTLSTEVPITRPLETTPLPGIVTTTPIPETKATPSPPPSILTSTSESSAISSATASSPSVTELVTVKSTLSTEVPITRPLHTTPLPGVVTSTPIPETKATPSPPPSILTSTSESSAISSATASSPRSQTTSIVKPTSHIPQTTTLSSIVTEGPSASSVTEPVNTTPLPGIVTTTPSKHSSAASLTTTPLPMTQSHSSSVTSTTEKISVPGTKVTPSPPPSILTSTLESPAITSASGSSPSFSEPVNVKSTLSTEVPITRPLETTPLPGIVTTTPIPETKATPSRPPSILTSTSESSAISSASASSPSVTEPVTVKSTLSTEVPITRPLETTPLPGVVTSTPIPGTKVTPSPPPSILTSTLESPAITSASGSSPSVSEPVNVKSTLSTEVPITRPLETTPLPGIVTTTLIPETKATPSRPPSILTSTSESSAISSASASSPSVTEPVTVKSTLSTEVPITRPLETTPLPGVVTSTPIPETKATPSPPPSISTSTLESPAITSASGSSSSVTEPVTVKSTLSTEVPITRPLETTPLPGIVTSTSIPGTKVTPSPPPSILTSTLESPTITSASASSPSVTEPVNVKSTLSTEVPITRPLETTPLPGIVTTTPIPETKATPSPPPSFFTSISESSAISSATASSPRSPTTSPSTSSVTEPVNTTPLPGIVTTTPSKHSSAASLTTTPLPMTQSHSSSVTSTTKKISVPGTKVTPSPPPSILTSTLESPAITSASASSPRPLETTPLPGIVTTTLIPETKATPSPPPSILTSSLESPAITSATASSPSEGPSTSSVTEPVTVKSTLSTEVPITRPLETSPLPGIVTSTPIPGTKVTPSPPPSILTSTLESPAITSATASSPSEGPSTSSVTEPVTVKSTLSTEVPITRPLETSPLPGIVTSTPIPGTKVTPSPPPSILTSTLETPAITSASGSSPSVTEPVTVKSTLSTEVPLETTPHPEILTSTSKSPAITSSSGSSPSVTEPVTMKSTLSTEVPITRPLETTPLPGIVTTTPIPETKATPSPPPSILTSISESSAISSASASSPSVTGQVTVKSTLSTEVPITRPLETTPLPGVVTSTPIPETKATPSPPPSMLTSTLESPAITSATASSPRSPTTSQIIYTVADKEGCEYYAECSSQCTTVRYVGDCTTPNKPTTSSSTPSPTTTLPTTPPPPEETTSTVSTPSQGSIVPQSNVCQTCKCSSQKDKKSQFYAVKCQPIVCNKNCKKGYVYQTKAGACCGECVALEKPKSACSMKGSNGMKINIENTLKTDENGCCQTCTYKGKENI